MPIKFLLREGEGGSGFFRRGGWKCQFYFYGRGDFSDSFLNPRLPGPLSFPERPFCAKFTTLWHCSHCGACIAGGLRQPERKSQ